MNTRQLSIASVIALALGATACSTTPSDQTIGTGVGAVAGGLVGDALFDNTLGTVGGAAAGALIGNQVGKKMDNNR